MSLPLPEDEPEAIVNEICQKLKQNDDDVKDFLGKVAGNIDNVPQMLTAMPADIQAKLMESAEVTSTEELLSKFSQALPTKEALSECLNDKNSLAELTDNIKKNQSHFNQVFREFEKNPDQMAAMMEQMKDVITPEMMNQFVPSRRQRRRARRKGLSLPAAEGKKEEPESFTCVHITSARKIKLIRYVDDCWSVLGKNVEKKELEIGAVPVVVYFVEGKNRRIRRLLGFNAAQILIVQDGVNLTAEDVQAWESQA